MEVYKITRLTVLLSSSLLWCWSSSGLSSRQHTRPLQIIAVVYASTEQENLATWTILSRGKVPMSPCQHEAPEAGGTNTFRSIRNSRRLFLSTGPPVGFNLARFQRDGSGSSGAAGSASLGNSCCWPHQGKMPMISPGRALRAVEISRGPAHAPGPCTEVHVRSMSDGRGWRHPMVRTRFLSGSYPRLYLVPFFRRVQRKRNRTLSYQLLGQATVSSSVR